MHEFKRIAVYCGSSNSVDARYFAAARATGRILAERGIGVVYGGGKSGLMGAVADAALSAGGEVIGVIPERLDAVEVGHPALTELHVVRGMQTRKALMLDLADGFIALPGGFGTWEEIMEAATQVMLGYMNKPLGLLNVAGYYDHLLAFIAHSVEIGFVRPPHAHLLQVATDPAELLTKLHAQELVTIFEVLGLKAPSPPGASIDQNKP